MRKTFTLTASILIATLFLAGCSLLKGTVPAIKTGFQKLPGTNGQLEGSFETDIVNNKLILKNVKIRAKNGAQTDVGNFDILTSIYKEGGIDWFELALIFNNGQPPPVIEVTKGTVSAKARTAATSIEVINGIAYPRDNTAATGAKQPGQ